MHDAKGRMLIKGDIVLVPMKIEELSQTDDYCNIVATSILTRRPDGAAERFSAFNTAVVLRANPDDKIAEVCEILQQAYSVETSDG